MGGGYLNLKGVGATYAQSNPVLVGARWMYNWGINPPLFPGVESVPMFWNGNNVGKPVGGNSPWIMWFNEPDLASQANMTPEYAALLWNTHIGDYPGKLHVAPSSTRVAWLEEFMSSISRKPDAISIHPYIWKGNDWGLFATQLDWWTAFAHSHGIGQIWITEFGLVTSDYAEMKKFMKTAIPVIQSFSLVTRYAWFQQSYKGSEPWAFSNCYNMSLEDYYTGALTALGDIYRGNEACDLNRDGEIDILDLVRFAQSFGQKVTW